MALKYRLKEGVGTHRRKAEKEEEVGKVVNPGEFYDPTPQELKDFKFKFELADDRGKEKQAS